MKILLIEDSERLCRSLSLGLSKSGYAVDIAQDGSIGLKYALAVEYDVIILDIMLPGLDGIALLRKLRAENRETHVLILSARDQTQDRILGLQVGADDYLVKPFDFDELLARIQALLRRKAHLKNPQISLGQLVYDSALKKLRFGEKNIHLTPSELSIIEILSLNRGQVITYAQLEHHLYVSDADVCRNSLEAHISSIRKKLDSYGMRQLVKTRRGFGYYIEHA